MRGLELVDSDIPCHHIFYSDCKGVVDTFKAGRVCWDKAKSEHGDLWEQIFSLAADRDVELVWVRAHETQAVAQARGVQALYQWLGNNCADVHAKLGANICRVPVDVREALLEIDKAYSGFLVFVAGVSVHCIQADTAPSLLREKKERVHKPAVSLSSKVNAFNLAAGDDQHELVVVGSRVLCTVCKQERQGKQGFYTLRASKCGGALRTRLSLALYHRAVAVSDPIVRRALVRRTAHTTRTTGAFLWCEKCGRHSSGKVLRGLAGDCHGTPKMGEYGYYQRKRLEQGQHPSTGRPLPGF